MNLVAIRSGDLACPWLWIDFKSYLVTFSSLSAMIWFARKSRLAFAQIYFKIFIVKQELEEERAAEACQSPYVFLLVIIPFNWFDEIFIRTLIKYNMCGFQIEETSIGFYLLPPCPSELCLLPQILPVSWILTLLFTPFPNTTFLLYSWINLWLSFAYLWTMQGKIIRSVLSVSYLFHSNVLTWDLSGCCVSLLQIPLHHDVVLEHLNIP